VASAFAVVQTDEDTDPANVDHAGPPDVPTQPFRSTDATTKLRRASRPTKEAGVHALDQHSVDAPGTDDTPSHRLDSWRRS
jgi:hypothetical protein